MKKRGFFLTDEEKAHQGIEILFEIAEEEKTQEAINELGKALQESKLFSKYEDRFFKLVNNKQ